jgi:hypothetical protein
MFNNPGGKKALFLSSKASALTLAAAPPPSSCAVGEVATLGTAKGMTSTGFSPNAAYALSLNAQGRLAVTKTGSPVPLFAAFPAFQCTGPFALSLQRSGNLVVKDSANRTVWSSGSACESPSSALQKCYSYRVSDKGQLVVQDQDGYAVWGSPADAAAVAAAGVQRKLQLVSSSAPELSCIWSGPSQAPSVLTSRDGRYVAAVDEAGTLQVRSAGACWCTRFRELAQAVCSHAVPAPRPLDGCPLCQHTRCRSSTRSKG